MKILTIINKINNRGTTKAALNYNKAYIELGHEVYVAYREIDENLIDNKELKIHNLVKLSDNYIFLQNWNAELIHLHGDGNYDDDEFKILSDLKQNSFCIKTNVFGRVDYTNNHLIDLNLHISMFNLWRWKRWLGRSNQIGIYIPNALDMSIYKKNINLNISEERIKFAIPENAFVYLHLGFKYTKLIIDAFVQIANKEDSAYLIFAPYNKKFDSYINRLDPKIYNRIIKLSEINSSSINSLIMISNCLLHAPKNGETFGYVLVEAQILGLFIITLSTPDRDNAQIEIINNGETGYIAGNKKEFKILVNNIFYNRNILLKAKKYSPLFIGSKYDSLEIANKIIYVVNLVRNFDFNNRKLILESDPNIILNTSPDYYFKLLEKVSGNISLITKLKMFIVFSFFGQKLVRLFRHGELIINNKVYKLFNEK